MEVRPGRLAIASSEQNIYNSEQTEDLGDRATLPGLRGAVVRGSSNKDVDKFINSDQKKKSLTQSWDLKVTTHSLNFRERWSRFRCQNHFLLDSNTWFCLSLLPSAAGEILTIHKSNFIHRAVVIKMQKCGNHVRVLQN